jgi:O-6-methylguanine DNA methyltransferase
MASDLQRRVWEALKMIPEGRVTTYGEIARYLGTSAVRAVGSAVGKNPDAPIVPCHRVVLWDGRIGQYSGTDGIAGKIALLADEGVAVARGRIVDFAVVFWHYPSQSVTRPSGS